MNFNTIIIGAGIAGISAAIQLKRAGINFALIEKKNIGGLVRNANKIENYPGINSHLTGTQFSNLLKKQLEAFRIAPLIEEVALISHKKNKFIIQTEKSSYTARNTIIATGTVPITLDQQNISTTKKIFYEIEPVLEAKNNKIIIIGSGDAAFDYALNLSQSNSVTLLMRGGEPKCLPLLHKRASKTAAISIHNETEIIKIITEADKVKITTTNDKYLTTDFIIAAIGRRPNIDLLDKKLKNCFLKNKNIKGLYFAGDIKNKDKRQLAIAAGDGIKAAMEIINQCR